MAEGMDTGITSQAGRTGVCFGWRMLIMSSSHKKVGYASQSHILVGVYTHVILNVHTHECDSKECGTAILVRGQVSM